MSKLTTTVKAGNEYHISLQVQSTKLSVAQLQILSDLVYVSHWNDPSKDVSQTFICKASDDEVTYKCKFSGELECWQWDMENSTITHKCADKHCTYEITEKGDHCVIESSSDINGNTLFVRFHCGLLWSWEDEPAIRITTPDSKCVMEAWFHHNICTRTGNPSEPSMVTGTDKYYHDHEGDVVRRVVVWNEPESETTPSKGVIKRFTDHDQLRSEFPLLDIGAYSSNEDLEQYTLLANQIKTQEEQQELRRQEQSFHSMIQKIQSKAGIIRRDIAISKRRLFYNRVPYSSHNTGMDVEMSEARSSVEFDDPNRRPILEAGTTIGDIEAEFPAEFATYPSANTSSRYADIPSIPILTNMEEITTIGHRLADEISSIVECATYTQEQQEIVDEIASGSYQPPVLEHAD